MSLPTGPQLVVRTDPGLVWRVGFRPSPWAWADWSYAESGRFGGRWDDLSGNFRTIYAGQTLLACLLEVLAKYRPDPDLAAELDAIDEDPVDAAAHPTPQAGTVDYSWLDERIASNATLAGSYCASTAAETIATLRPIFLKQTIITGADDFDAATLKDPRQRDLTRSVATWLYQCVEPVVDGIEFASRHGDELALWAVFERPEDDAVSRLLSETKDMPLTPDADEIREAFRLHRLRWAG